MWSPKYIFLALTKTDWCYLTSSIKSCTSQRWHPVDVWPLKCMYILCLSKRKYWKYFWSKCFTWHSKVCHCQPGVGRRKERTDQKKRKEKHSPPCWTSRQFFLWAFNMPKGPNNSTNYMLCLATCSPIHLVVNWHFVFFPSVVRVGQWPQKEGVFGRPLHFHAEKR